MPGSDRDAPDRRTLTVSALHGRDGRTVVPWLRLSGQWLRQAGFEPGAKYVVTVERGRLVLEARREEGSDA
ncbi:MAG: type I toxin-antitoxin system SymE family toxin [Trueperaceae bacterium]|nr:type I toxin-antitoxin system SymE family toxin [Trueperaceae bacterium]